MYFRHVVCLLGSLGYVIVFMLRTNLNVSILSMSKTTRNKSKEIGTCIEAISTPNDTDFHDVSNGDFDWDEYTQGIILGSFYFGYIPANVIAGRITDSVGSKISMGGGVFVTAVLTLLTPVAARWSYKALVAVRILEGFFEGFACVSMATLTIRWFPKSERSLQYSLLHSGESLGTVVGTLVSGVLCASKIFDGWPSSFYLPGLSGVVWLILWLVFFTEYPNENRWISSKELNYIIDGQEKPSKINTVPWSKIWKCVPYWAILITSLLGGFSGLMLMTEIPTFVGKILGFDILTNGYLSTVPPLLEIAFTIISGFIVDWILKRRFLTVNKTRKLFYTFGGFLSAVCVSCIVPSGCNLPLTSALLFMSKGFVGLTKVGPNIACLDMAPDFAGTLYGIYIAFYNVQGVISPLVVGVLTKNNQTMDQWAKIFAIAAALNLGSILVFCIFASSELQPWGLSNDTPVTDTEVSARNVSNSRNKNTSTL